MIQPLRKIHRRMFILLALALPVFFVAGILARHHVAGSNAFSKNKPDPTARMPQISQTRPAGAVR